MVERVICLRVAFGRPSVVRGDGDKQEPLFWRRNMDNPMAFVPLQTAMEALGATDETAFVKMARRHACLLKCGGIVRINLPELQRCVNEDFSKAQEQAAKRKTVKRDRGADLGLIEARLTLYPGRIEAKRSKIRSAEAAVKAADSPYLRRKLDKELTTFRDQLAKLEEGNQRDLRDRDEILNSGAEEPVASQK